ncbi:MAG: DHHA1 domain-containing protein [Clostridiales bacterium]|nr:MAG: DHHA1 domain-containing protein [Clostridiales bacterium]
MVAERGWHHGVIGIVSSKITEKYYKPSIVISVDDDGNGKASGRSISGFDLFDALKKTAKAFWINSADIRSPQDFRSKKKKYRKIRQNDKRIRRQNYDGRDF